MPIDIPAGTVIALVGSDEDTAVFAAQLRQAGAAALIAPPDSPLLHQFADEVWHVESGEIRTRGHVQEVLRTLNPAMRRGDGRAEVLSIETLDTAGQPVSSLTSGQPAAVRLTVRYNAEIADPVVGIMIRTRIGMEVYGTNTELEQVKIGPCAPGDERTLTFHFDCDLCPGFYTLTAASHDPDGVWHDWLEDAISFTVTDTRYTAGVANLRAKVELS